jgi:hypothetical protein
MRRASAELAALAATMPAKKKVPESSPISDSEAENSSASGVTTGPTFAAVPGGDQADKEDRGARSAPHPPTSSG